MKTSEAIQELKSVMRRDRYSRKTFESYAGWLERYFAWAGMEMREGRSYQDGAGAVDHEARVTAFLSHLAPNVGASTQNQCLCALVLIHREVFGKPLGTLPEWASAKRPKRLPEWVTPRESICTACPGSRRG